TGEPSASAAQRLDAVEQQAGNVQAGASVDFADAGRTGHVDLGQVAADHVQADEQHAAATHLRAHLCGNPAVAFIQLADLAATTGSEVAAEVTALRDTRQQVRHRLAIN